MTSPANAKVSYLTDPDSARGRLLSKAAHLFRVKGFERTTVRDLAREIGIQSGSIFHHFRTKEEILRAVMEEAILYNTERMEQQVNAAPNAREKVLALIRCELESVLGLTGEAMSVLVYEWRSLSDESQAYILNLRDKYEAIWLTALESAKADGLIDADTFVLRRFLTGALSWTTTWYKPGRELSIQALAEQALLLAIKNQHP
ncbi:MAG: TetR/AcrR family transcriptional regulator [Hahellaceae bacterium]|nr:TetR/AcrR family transcriptional regulator [Hahellaceae bacterium]MCP5169918.1 TetR/AcrR family transcriptional regulator [Hahellaceae bacterium]